MTEPESITRNDTPTYTRAGDTWHAATAMRYSPLCGAAQPAHTTHNPDGVTCPECRERAKTMKRYGEKGKR